ncbi:hypothetical protein AWC04_01470 [Mycolicibacterium fallax]|uniref:Uncharacterized protein n=1 Tax=Mycolicibacterium fallax TaxID=1793 RepID=A0A1X1RLI8_MYCFA|nr:hypothetical protein AWC04_01470 [Mycolicibacterium fallax]
MPSGVMVSVQPGQKVLSRWCSRQRGPRLAGWVGPPLLRAMMWSRSQSVAGRSQPGWRQVMSRERMNSSSRAEGR